MANLHDILRKYQSCKTFDEIDILNKMYGPVDEIAEDRISVSLSQEEAVEWVKYRNAYFALYNFSLYLRNLYKYEENLPDSDQLIDDIYTRLHEIASEYNYNIFE